MAIFLYLVWFSLCLSLFWELRDKGDVKYLHFVPEAWESCYNFNLSNVGSSIECFHSRGQHLCKFIGTKEGVFIRKELKPHRTGLGH